MVGRLELPLEERESVDAAMRHVEFLDAEIAAAEKLIAQQALSWPEIRRLMTVPGVNLICAASFIAAIGNPNRFLSSRTGRVSRAGPAGQAIREGPARSGPISKRGSPSARWALVEAAWTAVLQPGPLHAFYERAKARRGHGKAIVATARKLRPVLVHAHPRRGLRPPTTVTNAQEAPAPGDHRRRTKIHPPRRRDRSTNDLMREAELELARQAEASYKRLVQDQQAGAPAKKAGASVTLEHA